MAVTVSPAAARGQLIPLVSIGGHQEEEDPSDWRGEEGGGGGEISSLTTWVANRTS